VRIRNSNPVRGTAPPHEGVSASASRFPTSLVSCERPRRPRRRSASNLVP
jgi:hypothetical protein